MKRFYFQPSLTKGLGKWVTGITLCFAVILSIIASVKPFSASAAAITQVYYTGGNTPGAVFDRELEAVTAHYTVSGSGDNAVYTRNTANSAPNWTNCVPFLTLGSAVNFTAEFDYRFAPGTYGAGNERVWVTFGNATMARFDPYEGAGVAGFGSNGAVSAGTNTDWKNNLFYSNNGAAPVNTANDAPAFSYNGAAQHHITFRIFSNILTVTLDGGACVRTYNLASLNTGYAGGYVGIGTGIPGTAISNLSFTSHDGEQDTAYYGANMISTAVRAQKPTSDYYNITQDNEKKAYTRNAISPDGTSWLNSVPVIFAGSAVDFKLEFDYQLPAGSGEKWIWVTFGNVSKTAYTTGGVAAATGAGADASIYPTYYRAKKQDQSEVQEWLNEPSYSFNSMVKHHIVYRMAAGILTISLDGGAVVRNADLSSISDYSYTGGYVGFGTNVSGTVISDVLFTTLSVNDYTGWNSYYSEDTSETAMTAVDPTIYWSESDGTFTRKAVTPAQGNNKMKLAALFYGDQTFTNFEMNVDVKLGTNGWRRAMLGLGAQMGKNPREAGGGIVVTMSDSGYACVEGNLTNKDGYFSENGWGNHYSDLNFAKAQHLRVVVKDRLLSIYVNDDPTPSLFQLPVWYTGGYIYLLSNSSGAQFSNLSVHEIAGDTPPGDPGGSLFGKTALFVGDSISYGALDTPKVRAWAARIGFNNQMTYTNASIGGSTISVHPDATIPTVRSQIESFHAANYDYVIMEGGVNDALRNDMNALTCPLGVLSNSVLPSFDTSTFIGALEEMFYTVGQYYPGAKIGYIISYQVPQWLSKDKTDPYVEAIKQVCDKWDVPWLDLYNNDMVSNTLLDVNATTYLPDGLHPNAVGYDRITPLIEQWMQTLPVYEKSAISPLVFDDGYYSDFDLTFTLEFPFSAETADQHMWITLGNFSKTAGFPDLAQIGAALLEIKRVSSGSGNEYVIDYLDGNGVKSSEPFEALAGEEKNITVSVSGGSLTVVQNGHFVFTQTLPSSYIGGYVGVGAATPGVKISELKITADDSFSDQFSPYYTASLNQNAALTAEALDRHWTVLGSAIVRNGTDTNANSQTNQMAALYYNVSEFKNFELTVNYKSVGATGCYVGFGATMGKSWYTDKKIPAERAWQPDSGNNVVFLRNDGAVQCGPIATYLDGSLVDT
ncbi:MAG: SGNH/GDSL hydrolase family protein, partial [Oscillospiraceae bacterium]|nr:SGNH/GDSL hydrolase family protein [Oscillospiraceae bacterium]